MKPVLKRTLLAALPLLGLLLTVPPAALAKHHHHCRSEDRYGYEDPTYDDDDFDRGYPERYGYDARPYETDPYAYGGRPTYGNPSPYGGRPYYGGSPSADPYTMDPSTLLPALLGLLRPGY